jgi:hypothetical protein
MKGRGCPAHDADPVADAIRAHDSVRVSFGNDLPVHTGHGLLNINGEDFGIKFDRIARLAVSPDTVFCDGEVVRGRLPNRVVGLFEVENLNASLAACKMEFLPDRLFWNGQDRTGDDPVEVIEEYLLASSGRHLRNTETSATEEADAIRFGLCPVTRNIISRYLRLTETSSPAVALERNEHFDIFVSFGSEDRQLTCQVYNRLGKDGDRRVFFSDVTLNHRPFSRQIDRALDTSWALVAVGSRLEHLHKSWVQYEWESFHNDILSGHKPVHTPFVAFVTGVDPYDLPRPFRHRQAIEGEPARLDEALKRLTELIRKP